MNIADNDKLLMKLLDGMPPHIRSKCISKKVLPDTYILNKDDQVNYVYILCSGTIIVKNEFVNGQLYKFAIVDGLDFIGEIEVLANEVNSACTVQALTNCTLLQLKKEDFLYWLNSNHEFAIYIAQSVARKMYPTSYHHGDITFYSGIYKVVAFLIRVFESGLNQDPFILSKRRQDIGEELGISIRTVNRCIKILKDQNMIEIRDGDIVIQKQQYRTLMRYLSELI